MYPNVECSRCERTIADGEPYWSLSRMKETTQAGVIEVQDVVSLAQLCSGCAGPERPTVYQFLREPAALPKRLTV